MNVHKHCLRLIAAISFLSLLFISGCFRITPTPRQTELGGHAVSIIPDCQAAATHSERRYEKDGTSKILFYEFKCGDTTLLLKDNILNVNGRSYGLLDERDVIAVNYGKVSVNSTRRDPTGD